MALVVIQIQMRSVPAGCPDKFTGILQKRQLVMSNRSTYCWFQLERFERCRIDIGKEKIQFSLVAALAL